MNPIVSAHGQDAPFERVIIDPRMAGDCKMVADIDGDGRADLIIGGMAGSEELVWYHNPTWTKTLIGRAVKEFTTLGTVGDVDGDGDIDIVVPDGNGEGNLLWYENPRPAGDPFRTDQWRRHVIGTIGDWGKDVYVGDIDGDGRPDVVVNGRGRVMIFFQDGPDRWTQVVFDGVDAGDEGLGAGDVDGDGRIDLVSRGVWLENPGHAAARDPSRWKVHRIGEFDKDFKAVVADINNDGRMDVVTCSAEGVADLIWWEPEGGDPRGRWRPHVVAKAIERCHTLAVADMDGDGHPDIVSGQMHTSRDKEIAVWHNADGRGGAWRKQIVSQGEGIHNGVVADIDGDGRPDIFAVNWTGNPPARVYFNHHPGKGAGGKTGAASAPASAAATRPVLGLDRWTYKRVTGRNEQTFGLCFADVDRDGRLDIVSGRYWYRNPGGDLMGEWVQSPPFPDGIHACLAVDVDGDGWPDLIGQKTVGRALRVYWLRAEDRAGRSFRPVLIGEMEAASHSHGTQGYRVARLNQARPAIIMTSGGGLYYFQIPASNPEAGMWPRVHVSANPSDEGMAVADFDGDGRPDICATTGDSKRVEWYRNPGTDRDGWEVCHIGDFPEALYPDRCAAADLNGDGRPDIIVTEENQGGIAQAFWWVNPGGRADGRWERRLICRQATMNAMDVGDVDGDGHVDIVICEHRGDRRLSIFRNDGKGVFTQHVIDSGKEGHLGARLVDLTGDGRLDIVNICWDSPGLIHLWRNDNVPVGQASPAASRPTAQRSNSWGTVGASIGDGPEGDGTILLENRAIRVVYQAKRFSDGNKDHVITDFVVKKTQGQLAEGDQIDGIWMNADEGRGRITAARVLHDGPDRKTLRVGWDMGKVVQEFTLWPDLPIVRIDYIVYGINIVDMVQSVDTFEVYGARQWQAARAGITDEAMRNHPNPHHRLTDDLYPMYPHPLIAGKDWGIEEPAELVYNGHLILGAYHKATGLGFGRVYPARDGNYVKLLRTGFEVFANWHQPHRPFTSYLFAVTGGAEELMSVGKAIVDGQLVSP